MISEPTKLILVGLRITYQATGDATSDVVRFSVNGGRIEFQETDEMRITGSLVFNPERCNTKRLMR